MARQGKRHLVIPDIQARPGVTNRHLSWISQYAMSIHEKVPLDRIVLLGDFYDLPSLSSYDKAGSRAVEGRRVIADMDAGHKALDLLCGPWERAGLINGSCDPLYAARKRKRGQKAPGTFDIHVTYGNHEYRKERFEDSDARMEGVLGDFNFWTYGINEHPFWFSAMPGTATPVLDGIMYSHLFPLNAKGQVGGGVTSRNGCPSALEQIRRVGRSCVAGHKQGFDYDEMPRTGRRPQIGIIAGSCYLHNDGYMGGVNGDKFFRGIVVLNDITGGYFDICKVSLEYLKRRYE